MVEYSENNNRDIDKKLKQIPKRKDLGSTYRVMAGKNSIAKGTLMQI